MTICFKNVSFEVNNMAGVMHFIIIMPHYYDLVDITTFLFLAPAGGYNPAGPYPYEVLTSNLYLT